MHKKTILFNVSGHGRINKERIGGVEKVVLEAITSLKKHYDIILFGDFPWAPKGVKVIPFYGRMGGSIKHAINITQYLSVGLRKIKAIHADLIVSTHQRNQLLSYLYSKSCKIPFVSWELDHDPWVKPLTPAKKIYRYFAKKPTLTIAMSEEQRQRIIRSGKQCSTIKVVYQGIDTSYYTPVRNAQRDNYILYVAKFLTRKNHLELLKAFEVLNKTHPELRLVLVGPKSGGYTGSKLRVTQYYDKCQSFIVNNLKGKVVHYEDISEDELIKLYQLAMVYCMPSCEEGFGLTLLEAMSCGCACVVNKIAPLTEVIGKAGLLVNANSHENIAVALNKIVEDDSLRASLQAKARSRALKVFSQDRFASILKKYLDLGMNPQND